MRGSDIPPPPGYRPTPLATLGQQLVRLGQAMQNPNTKLGELTELVQACGVDLRICDTNKETRSPRVALSTAPRVRKWRRTELCRFGGRHSPSTAWTDRPVRLSESRRRTR